MVYNTRQSRIRAAAAAMVEMPSKVDVHHHYYPPMLRKAIEDAGGDPSGWYLPPWTVELDSALNDAIGVKTAILSCTAPGACIEKDPIKAAALARHCNEYAANIRDAQPGRYGFFASLPSLEDTSACLATLAHALDELRADGVVLFTRYGPGHAYLGHASFEPVWAELSRRGTVVLVHPTHPVDTSLVHPALPQPMYDYPHETGRAAMNLIVSGTLRRHPGCKVILSHAGGTLPYLIHRAAGMLPHTPVSVGRTTEELLEEARGFYFDTAISANEPTLKALLAFAKPGHVLFGSDFPNAPRKAIENFTRTIDEWQFTPKQRRAFESGTALELFPRLKQHFS